MGFVLETSHRRGDGVRVLRSRADVDLFVADLLAADWEHTAATVCAVDEGADADPDHELVVGVDAAARLGALRYAGERTWWSVGTRVNPAGVEFVHFGTGQSFPPDSEVPLAVVREALGELLVSGGRLPTCVDWREWERARE